MTPTIKRHLDAIASGAVTRSNIIGITKAMRAQERRSCGYYVSSTAPLVTAADITAIYTNLDCYHPRVTGELHTSGIALLSSKRYAKRLAHVADIIADIDHFRLVDWRDHWPVYRAYTSNGSHVTFQNVPWQSGGNGPEIIAYHRNAA